MVTELRVERERTCLDIEELTNLLDGGEAFTEKRRAMGELAVKQSDCVPHKLISAQITAAVHVVLTITCMSTCGTL